MLANFFQLNSPVQTYQEADLLAHFKTSDDLRNVLYKPDFWPDAKKVENKSLGKLKKKNFSNVSLSKTHISNITFLDCIFTDCLFIGATFENVEFHNCRFNNCNFYKAKIVGCYWDPLTVFFNKSLRESHSNIVVETFQKLMKNAYDMDQLTWAMNADIKFRSWKRAQLKYELDQDRINKIQFYKRYIDSLAYEYICGFGYSPKKFIITTLAVFLFISVMNLFVLSSAIEVKGEIVENLNFYDSIFYTFSILTVLGFSSIIPITSAAKIITVLEALFGIAWLGMFTSILVKRFHK